MLYMVVETFCDGDAVPVYRRVRDSGRGIPAGLRYVSSWVTADMKRCYQIMETDRRALLDEWIRHWANIVEFDVFEIITSAEARAVVDPGL